jgi:DNA-binding LytR/AlgR family response regulator
MGAEVLNWNIRILSLALANHQSFIVNLTNIKHIATVNRYYKL